MTTNPNSPDLGSQQFAGKEWSSSSVPGETVEQAEEVPIKERIRNAYGRFVLAVNEAAQRALGGSFDLGDLTEEEIELSQQLVDIAEETEQLMAGDPYMGGDGSIDNPKVYGFGENRDQIVHVVHMKPDEETRKDEPPLVMVPGWVANAKVVEPTLDEFVSRGREVISVQALHGVKKDRVRPMPELVDEGAETDELGILPEAIMKRVDALLLVLDEMDVEQIDAVGHSQGGVVLAIAATIRPEKFRSLTLVNSVGLLGDDSLRRLAPGFTLNTLKESVRSVRSRDEMSALARAGMEGAKSLRSDPKGTITQISEMGNFQTPELLKMLQDQGIRIGVMHTKEDLGFPADRVENTLASGVSGGASSGGKFVDDVTLDLEGMHGALYFDRELAGKVEDTVTRINSEKIPETNQPAQ
jgi:pimeloyl-ACP methyl ester carboxylesterase